MTVVTSNTTAKKVEIRKNGGFDNSFIAQLVQDYNGEKSVLQTKFYATETNAVRWANKVLGN